LHQKYSGAIAIITLDGQAGFERHFEHSLQYYGCHIYGEGRWEGVGRVEGWEVG